MSFHFGRTWLKPSIKFKDLFEGIPEIKGKSVEILSDLCEAPGGVSFKCIYRTRKSKENPSQYQLLLKVEAVASDQFTLYLEDRGSDYPQRGGIHLNISSRNNEELQSYTVVFDLPFEKKIIFTRLKPLLPANPCPINSPKEIKTEILKVDKRQCTGSLCSIETGWLEDGKICLRVNHRFATSDFTLVYEQELVDGYLLAELISNEDHNTSDCVCRRKESINSVLEFSFPNDVIEPYSRILVWGCMETNISGVNELMIDRFSVDEQEL